MAGFARQDEGQALVIAGLAMVVLMGALVLGVDWGYRFATSRAVQNQSDAAAVAAGRAVVTTWNGTRFNTTQEAIWNAACEARNANALGSPADATVSLTVTYYDVNDTQLDFFPSPVSSTTCALNGSKEVPLSTAFLRIEASEQFKSLFGMVTRQDLRALAAARVRLTAGASVRPLTLPPAPDAPVGDPGVGLSGSTTSPNVAMWPLAIRYDPTKFGPGSPRLIPLIDNGGPESGVNYLTLSHHSPRERSTGPERHQLITESDYTGVDATSAHHGHPVTGHLANAAGRSSCSVGGVPGWETIGLMNLTDAGRCDVPNWFYFGFRGSLSVGTDWSSNSWQFFVSWNTGERPDAFGPTRRASCDYPYAPVPSCAASLSIAPCAVGTPCQSWTGDWVETVPSRNVRASRVVSAMQSFITRYGRDLPDGSEKAVVVNVFLWDCSERFVADGTNDQWHLNTAPSGDCSSPAASGSPDRVHMIAVVPFTIRFSDVNNGNGNDCDGDCDDGDNSSVLRGTWGNVFGDAGGCRTTPDVAACVLNPVMNSAFLVPDE
jgi:hypothetical protein